jgi:hypothetical protein
MRGTRGRRPQKLTPITHSQVERGPNQGSLRVLTPALLQTRSTPPNRSMAAAARASTASARLTSVSTLNVSTPRAFTAASAAVSSPFSTSARTIDSPALAKRSASASPIPLAAPVTTAT